MDNYVRVKPLGEGSFGVVTLIKRRHKRSPTDPDELFILKENKRCISSARDRGRELREVRALMKMRHHPSIVEIVDAFISSENRLCLVTNYLDGGDLQHYLHSRASPPSPQWVIQIAVQIGLALHAIHAAGIVHRDVKPSNVFLYAGAGRCALGDFGTAKPFPRAEDEKAETLCGTPFYLSPEVIFHNTAGNDRPARVFAVTDRVDAWGFGATLFEMCTLDKAFTGRSLFELVMDIKRGFVMDERRRSRMRSLDPELVSLIRALLASEPGDRLEVKLALSTRIMTTGIGRLIRDVASGTITPPLDERSADTLISQCCKGLRMSKVVKAALRMGVEASSGQSAQQNNYYTETRR